MTPALILTEEKAEQAGYSGAGPYTFAGLFPGEWTPGVPLRIDALGFTTADEAEAKLVEAFETPILEWTEVGETEGFPERFNHAPSEMQARAAEAIGEIETTEDGELDLSKIHTHAQADEVAAGLEISFPEDPRPTVAQKVEAIRGMLEGNQETPTEEHGAPDPEPDE